MEKLNERITYYELMIREWIGDAIVSWALLEQRYLWLWGILAGIFLTSAIATKNIWLKFVFIFSLIATLIAQPGLFLLLEPLSSEFLSQTYTVPISSIYAFVIGCSVSSVFWFFILREMTSRLDKVKLRITKKSSLLRTMRTDIREVSRLIPQAAKRYSPERFFKKSGKTFLGLDIQGKPIYCTPEFWRSSHVDLIGTTGGGKGVAAGVLLTQAINQGEAVIAIDPKDDEYLPHVLGQAARHKGVPFIYIYLLGDSPQWNPFLDKNAFEIEELFSGAFGQTSQGGIDDVHRGRDRACARRFAQTYIDNPSTVSEVSNRLLASYTDEMNEANKFRDDLSEVASLPSINILNGLNIKGALHEGAVIYVRGSMRNPRALKMQKMFVISVIQHCEKRDRESARHVCLFLDEFKYLISKPSLEALGAIRDKRAHVILAHQSLGDLRDCPKDISPDSVVSSINENCRLKFAYKVNDPDTAEWLAKMSGQILVDDEVRTIKTGTTLAEYRDSERSLRQTERSLIDTNMLLSLPKGCAALYGNGLAQFTSMSPIKVQKRAEFLVPTKFTDDMSPEQTDTRTGMEALVDVD